MEDPTIFDYVCKRMKGLLCFQGKSTNNVKAQIHRSSQQEKKKIGSNSIILILGLALTAQGLIEIDKNLFYFSLILYIIAAVLINKNFQAETIYAENISLIQPPPFRIIPFLLSIGFAIAAFSLFHSNRFTFTNVLFWVASILLYSSAFWDYKKMATISIRKINFMSLAGLFILMSLVLYMRIAFLNHVPAEMFSDHAEKLLDVADILSGKFSIFFPRNTGREAIQFYLTAIIIKLFNTELSFLSLKIGTVFIGILTLPFIYLIAKEIKDKTAGIFAAFTAGIAYWPNVISRVALRYTLYPFFTAATIYYFIRGIKWKDRNSVILSGLFLGLGLQGYSSFRIVPILILIGFLIWLARASGPEQRELWQYFGIIIGSSVLAALPLIRYAFDNPIMFNFRALTRIFPVETVYSAPVWKIFLTNSWNALMMFFYDNGEIWVHSIPHRPALDWISAAIFFIGLMIILNQIIAWRRREDIFLLSSIYILLLPSILSLAFPSENPSLNRTAGAFVPVFVVIGIGLSWIVKTLKFEKQSAFQKTVYISLSISIFTICVLQNYDLVFNQYADQFCLNAWNTSELASVVKSKVSTGVSEANIYVIPYPHWVDTRLVGLNAGYPQRDFALYEDKYIQSLFGYGEKVYLLKPEDDLHLYRLISLLRNPKVQLFESSVPGKNFIILTGL